MNLPNKLSIIRIALVPFFIFFLLTDFTKCNYLIALIIFFVSAITDHIDGKIARKYNLTTDFGKFLDPLADKVLVMSAFICFVDLNIISSVAVIIMLSREFIVTSIRLVASKSGKVIAANIWGKAKTVSQMVTIIVIIVILYTNSLINANYLSGIINLDVNYKMYSYNLANLLVWICTILTVISGIIYVCDNKDVISKSS